MTAQPIKLKKRVKMGATRKMNLLETLGIIVSFTISFKTSANGCKRPKNPTTLGPFLLCIAAITFLSIKVKYAIAISKGKRRESDRRSVIIKSIKKTIFYKERIDKFCSLDSHK